MLNTGLSGTALIPIVGEAAGGGKIGARVVSKAVGKTVKYSDEVVEVTEQLVKNEDKIAEIGKIGDVGKTSSDSVDNVVDDVVKGGTASKCVEDTGKTIWPPNNGAFADTEKIINLNKDTTFGRIGGDTGSFVAPPKTSPDKLSLAPGTDISKYTEYVVTKTISGVEKSTVAPWFDKPNGGTQFKLPMTIKDLILEGYIAPK